MTFIACTVYRPIRSVKNFRVIAIHHSPKFLMRSIVPYIIHCFLCYTYLSRSHSFHLPTTLLLSFWLVFTGACSSHWHHLLHLPKKGTNISFSTVLFVCANYPDGTLTEWRRCPRGRHLVKPDTVKQSDKPRIYTCMACNVRIPNSEIRLQLKLNVEC